jgi:dolichol-phosphate mannosyltransferase
MNVVIILPTYNEKGNIERLIPVLQNVIFPKIKKHKMFILVADDNSPDGTGEEVKKLMKKWPNIDINSGEKRGLGAAYVRGMSYAIEKMDADIMFEFDADFQHDPEKIPEFLEKIDEGYDMVIGNRYSDGGSIPKNWPLPRKIFSIVANIFVRTIFTTFSIHDWTGGYRALTKEVFLKEKSHIDNYKGYIFQISFLHKAVRDGFKIAEVPFHFQDRNLGRSKIAPLGYILEVFKYVLSARAKELITGKFGKFLMVGGFGFGIHWVAFNILLSQERFIEAYIPTFFKEHYPETSNLLSAVFAIFSNYNLNNVWTFGERKAKTAESYFLKMIQFYATSAFGVVFIQTGTIFLLGSIFGRENNLLANAYFVLGTFLLMIWNFTIYNKIIWRKKTSK